MSSAPIPGRADRLEHEIVDRHDALGFTPERRPLSESESLSRLRLRSSSFWGIAEPISCEVEGRRSGPGYVTLEKWLAPGAANTVPSKTGAAAFVRRHAYLPTSTSDILARLQQELSAARSRNAAEEIFCTAERLLSDDDLDSFATYYADILHELPE
jgi:hypothetical protein